MLKYVSKLAMDILPSVAATVIGAYIVNHYMVNRPAAEPTAAVSSVDPKKAEVKTATKPIDGADVDPAESGDRPRSGAEKVSGPAEKAVSDRSALDKPQERVVEKSADRPADIASLPTEPRRHPPALHDKPAGPASSTALVVQPSQVETSAVPEEHRDANDLARAAIERLRATGGASTRTPEAVRATAAAPAIPATPPMAAPMRPLPPPILVSTASANSYDSAAGSSQLRSSYPSPAGYPTGIASDPLRPTPPANIPSSPVSPPLDLHADATGTTESGHKTVAEGMFSAVKSVFLAVLPK